MALQASRWPCLSCTPRRDERNSWTLPEVRLPTRKHFSIRSWATGQTSGAWTSRARHPARSLMAAPVRHALWELPWRGWRAARSTSSRGETYEKMVRTGLATTLEAIDKNLRDPDHDTSLCHGLSGLMDIVLTAGTILEDGAYLEHSFRVARVMIDRHARSGSWPSGLVSRGPNPSLMLGSAGVGYSLLRLHDPKTVPSVLLLAPGEMSH